MDLQAAKEVLFWHFGVVLKYALVFRPTLFGQKISTPTNSHQNTNTVNNLKKAPIVKNTYTISEDDKNKILEYIDKVDKTNYDFKRTEKLSVTLNNVDTNGNILKPITILANTAAATADVP